MMSHDIVLPLPWPTENIHLPPMLMTSWLTRMVSSFPWMLSYLLYCTWKPHFSLFLIAGYPTGYPTAAPAYNPNMYPTSSPGYAPGKTASPLSHAYHSLLSCNRWRNFRNCVLFGVFISHTVFPFFPVVLTDSCLSWCPSVLVSTVQLQPFTSP